MKPTVLLLAAAAAAASLLAGCDAPQQPPQTPPSDAPASPPPPASTPPHATSSDPASSGPESTPTAPAGPDLPKPAPAEAAAFAKASNAFGFDIAKSIGKKPGNYAYSAASITTAIAMTWGGAVGPTSDEMRKVMHFEGKTDQVLGASGKLVADLQRRPPADGAPVLAIANRLFGEKTFTFQKPYLESTEKTFGAPLEPLDFVGAAQPSRTHINDWVAKRTKDRIKDLIPPPGIDKNTRLVLVNAVYFLGDWVEPFKKEATGDAPFAIDGAGDKPVPTMHRTDSMSFAEVDGTQLVELPYVGGRFAMLFAIPGKKDGLPALESSLDGARYDRWVKGLATENIALSLPRFEVDPPESIALRDAFVGLGMKLAFDREKADFTTIANPPKPADRLYIGNVFHKAFVRVDEKGTEAAAATAVVMPKGGSAAPASPRQVKVDRPFLFFLRDRESGVILFAGRVVDPGKKG